MTKYKSLVFRELKLSRKHYLGMFALSILFLGLMVLCVFVAGGEFVRQGERLDTFSLIMTYMFAAISTYCAVHDSGVFKADINSGWNTYSYALPVTAFEKAASNYIVKIITIIAGMAVTILGSAAIFAAGGSTLTMGTIFGFFLFVDVFLAFEIVYQAIILRANDMKSLKKLGSIAGGIAFVVIFVLPEFIPAGDASSALDTFMTDMETMQSPSALNKYLEYITIPDVWGYVGIALMFVLLAVGFVVTWKSYERREA